MNCRQRTVYVTVVQKRKLLQLITENPELADTRLSQGVNYRRHSQLLWQSIAKELNAVPGARKTWKQWRKTFQDIKSKYKKSHQEKNGHVPNLVLVLNEAEREILGFKHIPENKGTNDPEFVSIPEDNLQDTENMDLEDDSPHEEKVFSYKQKHKKSLSKGNKSSDCLLNCDKLAAQEERKIKMKEDFLNFKKEYLTEKLKIMREQAEALKSIAREMSKS